MADDNDQAWTPPESGTDTCSDVGAESPFGDSRSWTDSLQSDWKTASSQFNNSSDADKILGTGHNAFSIGDDANSLHTFSEKKSSDDSAPNEDEEHGDDDEDADDDADPATDDETDDVDGEEFEDIGDEGDESADESAEDEDDEEVECSADSEGPSEKTTEDGTTHYYDKDGKEVRHRTKDGREFVHTRDKNGKEHIAEDKPITDARFNPHADMPAERKQMLDDQLKDMCKLYANDKNEISMAQHGKLLQELAGRKDLTEHDKLYMLGQLVHDYNNTKEGKGGTYRLTSEGADPAILNDFAKDRLRHQVIEPTNDGYHSDLANGSWDDAVKGINQHEGLFKQIRNAGRAVIGKEGGGTGFNYGDATASMHQVAAIMNARAGGQWNMQKYADEWNKRFLKK